MSKPMRSSVCNKPSVTWILMDQTSEISAKKGQRQTGQHWISNVKIKEYHINIYDHICIDKGKKKHDEELIRQYLKLTIHSNIQNKKISISMSHLKNPIFITITVIHISPRPGVSDPRRAGRVPRRCSEDRSSPVPPGDPIGDGRWRRHHGGRPGHGTWPWPNPRKNMVLIWKTYRENMGKIISKWEMCEKLPPFWLPEGTQQI